MSLLKDFTDLGDFYADKGGNRPYLEKRSNAYLDDFTRNAGSNNYTKFARDVNRWGQPGCQGQPWCAVYQFWTQKLQEIAQQGAKKKVNTMTRIGVANIRERMKLLYADRPHSLTISSEENHGTAVDIWLPLLREEQS